jgi:hypothetical protein
MPWVYKRRQDGAIANDCFIYVDDNKLTGSTALECWKSGCRFLSKITNLGVQDAKRKRTSPTLTPGPWAGSVAHTEGGIFSLVSGKQWAEAKELIGELLALLDARTDGQLPHHRLLQIRGFLVYVSRAYPWMPPYLKGLHLTIDSWRPGRGKDGYKLKASELRDRPFIFWRWETEEWIDLGQEDYEKVSGEKAQAPELVRPVDRLRSDLLALSDLTQAEEPVLFKVRASSVLSVLYLVGDASGKGFGSAMWDRDGIFYESGHYTAGYQRESSNFREADNLVTRMERLELEGRLGDVEIFIFTDNSSFGGTFFKGHSTSRKLTGIILRLRKLQLRTGSVIHVIHIAGTRMKECGIDGLSRGDLLEGMMKSGADPLVFLPLAQSADERTDVQVRHWVNTWWNSGNGDSWCGAGLTLLSPKDWFDLKNVPGPRLWIPPPAAMGAVVEMFSEDRLVRPHLPHVIVVPRLMTFLWRKQLAKDADVVLTIPVGQSFWPTNMHEALLLIMVLPLTHVPDYRDLHHHGPYKWGVVQSF